MIDERVSMYAVTGITGRVGGIVAGTLLDAGLPVRAVVRAAEKGRPWAAKGCEVAIASVADADGLAKAFSGVDGVFLMTPPDFDPEPGFPRTHEAIAAIKAAIDAARPGRVVFLSTVGAQVAEFNLLNNAKITEEGLCTVHVPVAFLRAAWFMENGQLGCDSGEGRGCSLVPAATRSPDSDGRDGRHWTYGSGSASRKLGGPARCRT
jgi:NAD(P)H dehydrogenase (quinone)